MHSDTHPRKPTLALTYTHNLSNTLTHCANHTCIETVVFCCSLLRILAPCHLPLLSSTRSRSHTTVAPALIFYAICLYVPPFCSTLLNALATLSGWRSWDMPDFTYVVGILSCPIPTPFPSFWWPLNISETDSFMHNKRNQQHCENGTVFGGG